MTDPIQEIREDYDHESNPIRDPDKPMESAFGDDIDTLFSDVTEGNRYESQVQQLLDTAVAIEAHGINSSAFAVMKTTGLLSGTSLQALAIESIGRQAPDALESQIALEALFEKIKEKMSYWADKILSLVKHLNDKVLGTLSSVWTKITELASPLASKAWDKTKSAGHAIKAHPYKSAAIAAGAVVGVAGVLALIASSMPGDYHNESALTSFIHNVSEKINGINWFGGKLHSKVVDGVKIVYSVETDATGGVIIESTAEKLGWSATAVKSITGILSRGYAALRSALSAVGAKFMTGVKFINNTDDMGSAIKTMVAAKSGSKLAGWTSQQFVNKVYATVLWSLAGVITKLLTVVVYKAFNAVKEAFEELKFFCNIG